MRASPRFLSGRSEAENGQLVLETQAAILGDVWAKNSSPSAAPRAVPDASALLAFLRAESGTEMVDAQLPTASLPAWIGPR